MKIFNHTSRVITVKNTAFEGSLGMEKSLEISADAFDFDRTVEIGFLTLKESKSKTEIDVEDSFNGMKSRPRLVVERTVDIPTITIVTVGTESELHIYSDNKKLLSILNPQLTIWAVKCKDENGKTLKSPQYFTTAKDRRWLRSKELIRAIICTIVSLILAYTTIHSAWFVKPIEYGTACFAVVVLLFGVYVTLSHWKFALWAHSVKPYIESVKPSNL